MEFDEYDESRQSMNQCFTTAVYIPTIKKSLEERKLNKCKPYRRVQKPEKGFKRPSEASLRKYTQHHEIPLLVRNLGKDELLLSFRQFSKQMRTWRRKYQKLISCQNEYKIRSTELKRRLHVESQPDPIDCFTDVDEQLYKCCISGRSSTRPGPHFRTLSFLYTYSMRKKIELGFKTDKFFNIDVNHKIEQKIYNKTVLTLLNESKNFDKFLLKNYKKSIRSLEKWDEIRNQVDAKRFELEYFASQLFTITSRLIGLDYMYKTQQKYGRFLYYLSPPIWRGKNKAFARSVEIEAKGFDFGDQDDEDSFTVLFDRMQKECASQLTKPALYFTHPSELLTLFKGIEVQQHYHFTHVLRLSNYVKSLKMGIRTLEEMIAHDTAMVAHNIRGIESEIKYYYENSNHLRTQFFKILTDHFYNYVSSPEVLKWNVHLEFCYKNVFKKKPMQVEIITMAKFLEDTFMDYTFKLEGLSGKKVQRALATYIKQEKLKEKRSLEAAKELRLFSRMEHKLMSAFNFKYSSKLKNKSMTGLPVSRTPTKNTKLRPKVSSIKSTIPEKKSISEFEEEYLRLFTDWTEGEDPYQYLLKCKDECLNQIFRLGETSNQDEGHK